MNINIPKKEKKDNQSISNLTCSTDTGIMLLENLTLQDTNAVCSSSLLHKTVPY